MLTLSKPLTAAQLRTYHAEEFSNAKGNYYAEDDQVCAQWHGRLAQQWGLSGPVREEHIHRLADGHHPITDAPLVRRQASRSYSNERGHAVQALEHRAGWDATFSAPKSVSLTALVGLRWPRYAGLYTEKQSHLYVSRGVGFVGPPMRGGSPPEIVKVTLTA